MRPHHVLFWAVHHPTSRPGLTSVMSIDSSGSELVPNDMLSRFLERAHHFNFSRSALTRLVHDQIMTSCLGPNFDQGLTAGLFFRICDSVLRAFHRLVIQLSDH